MSRGPRIRQRLARAAWAPRAPGGGHSRPSRQHLVPRHVLEALEGSGGDLYLGFGVALCGATVPRSGDVRAGELRLEAHAGECRRCALIAAKRGLEETP